MIIYNDDNNINNKDYLHRGPCPPCRKMNHEENLDQSQNHFEGTHNLNCKIS